MSPISKELKVIKDRLNELETAVFGEIKYKEEPRRRLVRASTPERSNEVADVIKSIDDNRQQPSVSIEETEPAEGEEKIRRRRVSGAKRE